jgi:DNA-3-methyladenine glycosylase I
MKRCSWPGNDPLYLRYHDEEWGAPVHDDSRHFEFLVLEGAQAGLSWITILKRREEYREAFAGFDPVKVAKFTEADAQRLIKNEGIIRNRQKVRSAINNAKVFLRIQQEFGSFDDYIWKFVNNEPKQNNWASTDDIPSTSNESDKLSADLKQRGMSFVGSIIIYAHMQACGLVNDHLVNCFRHKQV